MPAPQSNPIFAFWQWLSDQGISELTPQHRATHIRVSNRIALVIGLLTIPFVFYFSFSVYNKLLIGITSLFFFLVLSSLLFNRLRWYFMGKVIPLIMLELSIFSVASVTGVNSGFQWLYAPILYGSVLYFGARERQSLALVSGLAVVLYITLELTDYSLFQNNVFSDRVARFLSRANMFSSCLISVAVSWLSLDITRKRRVQLIKAKETITAVFEHSNDAIFLVDPERLTILECNRKAQTMMDIHQKENIIGRSLIEFCEEIPSQDTMRSIKKQVSFGGWEGKAKYLGANNVPFWGSTAINDLQLDRRSTYMVRIADVTELQESRISLKRQEVQLKEALRMARMGNSLIDTKNNKIYWSESLHEIFGLPEDFEITLESFRPLVHPEDREATIKQLSESFAHRKPFELEYRAFRKNDGRMIYIHSSGKAMYDRGENAHLMVGVLQDVTEQKMAEEAITNSRDLFALSVQATNDGIWDWNLKTNEVYFSPRWKEMLGYQDHELDNTIQTWERVIFDDDLEKARHMMDAYNQGATNAFEIVIRCHHRNGTTAHILSRAVHLKNAQGEVVRMIGAHTDITHQTVHEQELESARDAAQRANRFKSTFLANMSHEIRTPINGILGFTDLLLKTTPSKEQREYLQYIYSSGDTLLQLLNDILDLNKIEQGKLEVENIHFNFRSMFSKTLLPYQYMAREKGLQFNYALGEGVPKYIVGDPVRIRQVLINLINNAIKFTNQGRIEVILDAVNTPNGKLQLVGTVTDSGNGIPTAVQNQIFDSFTQADNSITRKYGGSGLGLTIVNQLVSLMDGKVEVQSPVADFTEKGGTRFRFSLLVEQGMHSEVEDDQRHVEKNVRFNRSWRILVAEDNKVNQLLAKKVLTQLGAEVDVANNGEESLQMIQSGEFDAVIMDLQMPIMDGYEATRQILKVCPDLPVIALSANVYREDIQRCLDVGMVDHIAKPFSEKSIFTTLQRWLPINQ